MRKIIGNKVYDTDSATQVGSADNGAYTDNLSYVEESLYRKRTGEYFLHGSGGARTRYAMPRSGDGGWSAGERIVPLDYQGARRWAEKNLDAPAYEREFGTPDDDAGSVMLTVRVPAQGKAALDRECSETGESRSSIVARLLESLNKRD